MDYDEAIRLFEYNPTTGELIRRVTMSSRAQAGDVAGNDCGHGYLKVSVNYKQHYVHRVIWLMVHGEWPGEIDHIDHDRGNNKLSNLRVVSRLENSRNSSMKSTNKSGVNGVSWAKKANKWHATIWDKGKMFHLGYFGNLADAAQVRYDAEQIFGYHPTHGR